MTEGPDTKTPRQEWLGAGLLLGWRTLVSLVSKFTRPATAEVTSPVFATAGPKDGSGRTSDRNEDLEKGVNLKRRQRWGTLIVSLALFAAAAGGVAFQWIIWTDPQNNLLLGGTLAIFMGGLGAGLVFHAHWLMIHKEATEERETLPSPQEERDDTYAAFADGKHDVQRRGVLTWLVVAGVGSALAAVVSYIRSLGTPPGAVIFDTEWKRGQRLMTVDQKPATIDMLQPGETVIVFPEDQIGSERAQTVLIRVQEKLLRLPNNRSDWAPSGYVAYSRVCTHAGCVVGLYEKSVDQLLCPCHQSTFDVLRAGCPTGGPAVRPLPQLPLYADADGTLRAGGGFSSPPGPGFWGYPV